MKFYLFNKFYRYFHNTCIQISTYKNKIHNTQTKNTTLIPQKHYKLTPYNVYLYYFREFSLLFDKFYQYGHYTLLKTQLIQHTNTINSPLIIHTLLTLQKFLLLLTNFINMSTTFILKRRKIQLIQHTNTIHSPLIMLMSINLENFQPKLQSQPGTPI